MIKIQKKWKIIKLRKMMYKATIRNIWNKNIAQYYFSIKRDKVFENNALPPEKPEISPTTSPVNLMQGAQGYHPLNTHYLLKKFCYLDVEDMIFYLQL